MPRVVVPSFRFVSPLAGALLLALVVTGAPAKTASAAKVYRCGNVFQDQPCPEPKIADARPTDAAPPPRPPADCQGTVKERADCLADGAQRQNAGAKR